MLTEALDKDKEFVEAYYRLGIVYISLKDYNNAAQLFEKGLTYTNEPAQAKGIVVRPWGDVLYALGRYADAEVGIE